MKNQVKLPTVLTKDTHFFKDYVEELTPFLGKPYISYSSVSSWFEYREDFIKQKFANIKLPSGVYAELGSYIGEAVETGKFSEENPNGFTGQDNVNLDVIRPKGGEYEKLVIIDRGSYFIVGFIDIYVEKDGLAHIQDLKTGGKKKEDSYISENYIQVILYAYAIEQTGKKIGTTSVLFIRRTGSHISPPLHLSEEQFQIPLVYNKKRVTFALGKVDEAVKEISELYTTYEKIFK
jgi:hypothetical protein